MGALLLDCRIALRMLRKRPVFAAIAVLCLAIGIGANTAVFSLVNAVLLRALPYQDPTHLVRIWNQFPGTDETQATFSQAEFLDLVDHSETLEEVSIVRARLFNLTGGDQPELVIGAFVSASIFDLLGVQPAIGRGFRADEDRLGHGQVVVLSHDLWTRRFGADPDVLDRQITINDLSYTVIGVMPPRFYFGRKGRELWLPQVIDRGTMPERDKRWHLVLGRLRRDATPSQVRADMANVVRIGKEQFPQFYPDERGRSIDLVPLREEVVGDIRASLWLLFGAVGLVLLIACTNVANLLIARGTTRDREVAVRMALGGGKRTLIRQFLVESLTLTGLGALAGIGLAMLALRAVLAMAPARIPRLEAVAIDGQVLAFTLGISLLTGVLFGLLPASQGWRDDMFARLRESGEASPGRRRGRRYARQSLVIAEVTLALMVLIGSGLLYRSYQQLRNVDLGFDPNNLLTFELFLPAEKYSENHQVTAFFDQLLERLRALPGVEAASTVNALPQGVLMWDGQVAVEGMALEPGAAQPSVGWRMADGGYFDTLGIPLITGRTFDSGDHAGARQVVVVDQRAADRLWPGESPIDKRIKLTEGESDPQWRQVVGVVGSVRHTGIEAPMHASLYVPYAQFPRKFMYFAVRASGDPTALVPAARAAVLAIDAEQAIFRVRTMDEILASRMSWRRFYTSMLLVFAGVGLILVMVGVYAVMAYVVKRRTREIGIRMALGAGSQSVRRMVIRQGLTLAIAGVGLGLLGAFALLRLLRSMLYGIEALDPATFLLAPLLVLALIALACYLPARRTTLIDPNIALRYE